MEGTCARVLVRACALCILIVGVAVGPPLAEALMVESFETFDDGTQMRSLWQVEYTVMPLTIELSNIGDIPFKGPSEHGDQYMRVNYLYSPATLSCDLGGDDWSDFETFRVWYRGIPFPANDVIELQVELYNPNGSWWGPVEADVSTCEAGPTYCGWSEHSFDFVAWENRHDVHEIRLHITTQQGSAEFYLDAIEILTQPVSAADESWGRIKALYLDS